MSRILAVLAANALFVAAAHAAPFEGEDYTNATLLISTGVEDMRAGAKALARHPSANPAMLDLAANMLWLGCKGQRGVPPDAQVALGSVLAHSGNARYRDVLTYCADRSLQPQVKQGTEEALARLPDTNPLQFVGGSVRLYGVAVELSRTLDRDSARRTAPGLAALRPGLLLQAVYQQVGPPDGLTAEGEQLIARYGDHRFPFVMSADGWQIAGAAPPVTAVETPPPVVPPPAPPKPAAPVATPPVAPKVAAADPPPPAPKAAPSPPPAQPAPPPPVAVASAKPVFYAGQVVHLRAGAQVRARPLADSSIVGVGVAAPLTLKSSMTNTSGVWWFVTSQNKIGWVPEGALAP